MKTALTKNEVKYIKSMFDGEPKNITNIKQLPVGWIALFMENREQASKRQ